MRGKTLAAHGIVFDTASRECLLDGTAVIDLSPGEAIVLELLMESGGSVVSYDEIRNALANGGWISEKAVKMQAMRLKRRIGAHRVKNIRGTGYRLA